MQSGGGGAGPSSGGQGVKTILVGEDHQPQLLMMMEGPSPSGAHQLVQHFQLPTSSVDGGGESVAVAVIPATTSAVAGGLRVGQPQPIFVNAIPSTSSSSAATISKQETSSAASSNLIVISDQNHRNSEASGKSPSNFFVSQPLTWPSSQGGWALSGTGVVPNGTVTLS